MKHGKLNMKALVHKQYAPGDFYLFPSGVAHRPSQHLYPQVADAARDE